MTDLMSALLSRGFTLQTFDAPALPKRWCENESSICVLDEQGSPWVISRNRISLTEMFELVLDHNLDHVNDEVVEA
jgi:hypothetical protein